MIKTQQGIMKRLLILPVLMLLSACTLSIGGPSRLPDPPAPTALHISGGEIPLEGVPGKSITLPAGFKIEVFADGLESPRMMALGPDGQVYVAERGNARVQVFEVLDIPVQARERRSTRRSWRP